nr:hypothetical protein GCM10020092_060430 [Actinoplanes digitatis]
MSDQQPVDAARALADRIIRGEPGHALIDQTGEVRRRALRLVHEFVVKEDSSYFGYFGRVLAIAEVLPTPWTRDDLVWALGLLLHEDPLTTISDAPFWVPALITTALDPADLDGLEDQLSAAFAALHDTDVGAADGLRRLAQLYGAALSRFNQGVPADLSIALRYAHGDAAGLPELLADAGVREVFRFAAELAKLGTGQGLAAGGRRAAVRRAAGAGGRVAPARRLSQRGRSGLRLRRRARCAGWSGYSRASPATRPPRCSATSRPRWRRRSGGAAVGRSRRRPRPPWSRCWPSDLATPSWGRWPG